MGKGLLQGCRVLVVEDDSMIAYDVARSLEEAGATVIGPAHSIPAALALLKAEREVHGAVLDINLHGDMVFPVADVLALRGVPFVFATGYEKDVLPSHYHFVKRCQKPVSMAAVAEAIGATMFSFLAPGDARARSTKQDEPPPADTCQSME